MFGFSPVWQDPFGKFGCLVLSGQETHMPSLVEPYNEFNCDFNSFGTLCHNCSHLVCVACEQNASFIPDILR